MAWTQDGIYARSVIWRIVYGGPWNGFDPFDKNKFEDWHPTLDRIGFDQAIVNHVFANAPADNGIPAWYTCKYCQWEYPIQRCQIDHVIPWEDYSLKMTTKRPLGKASALQVWVGCNDVRNLAVACDSCNASKGNRPVTPQWLGQRRQQANQQSGF